jgi:hypothetical protein
MREVIYGRGNENAISCLQIICGLIAFLLLVVVLVEAFH